MKLNSGVLSSTATLVGGGIHAAFVTAIPAARKLTGKAGAGTSGIKSSLSSMPTSRTSISPTPASAWNFNCRPAA